MSVIGQTMLMMYTPYYSMLEYFHSCGALQTLFQYEGLIRIYCRCSACTHGVCHSNADAVSSGEYEGHADYNT